jgi:hypothetical protein
MHRDETLYSRVEIRHPSPAMWVAEAYPHFAGGQTPVQSYQFTKS